VAGYIRDEYAHPLCIQLEEVVEISSHGPDRPIVRRRREARDASHGLRQDRRLDLSCEAQLSIDDGQALCLAAQPPGGHCPDARKQNCETKGLEVWARKDQQSHPAKAIGHRRQPDAERADSQRNSREDARPGRKSHASTPAKNVMAIRLLGSST
jgi:hypothetical protein